MHFTLPLVYNTRSLHMFRFMQKPSSGDSQNFIYLHPMVFLSLLLCNILVFNCHSHIKSVLNSELFEKRIQTHQVQNRWEFVKIRVEKVKCKMAKSCSTDECVTSGYYLLLVLCVLLLSVVCFMLWCVQKWKTVVVTSLLYIDTQCFNTSTTSLRNEASS
jgi:hypothetical protein